MGMASSQARLLNLTSRMHQIEYKAAKLEAQKLQMANESRKAYLDYQNAMEQTKIQRQTLATDASVEWKDLTFADLMYGTSNAPATTGAITLGAAYFGDSSNTNGSNSFMNYMIGMYSLQDGKMFVTEDMKVAYDNSSNADEFARRMGATGTVSNSAGVELNVDDVDHTGMLEELAEEFVNSNPVIPEEPVVNEDEITNTNDDYVITRKGGNKVCIEAGQTEQRLKVVDDLHGTKYYTISTSDEPVNIKILDNGRLLIEGNGAIVTADDNQKDDIILKGVLNTINTGNEEDIVRVGTVLDSKNYYINSSTMLNSINTGDGDDYVQNFGMNYINTGAGSKDVLYDNNNQAVSTGVEYTNSVDDNSNQLDWSIQGYYGDCQTLALINSINNQGNFNQYFQVVDKNDGSWEVKFKQSNITVNVTPADLEKTVNIDGHTVVAKATGDKDISIIEAAFRKAIQQDNIYMDQIGNSSNFHEVAKVILGNDKSLAINMNSTICDYLLQQYKYGGISNLVFGTSQNQSNQAIELGIYAQHAYSVKSFNENSITMVNPHDSKDSITLDWNDFYKYFKSIIVYGDAADKVEQKFAADNISVNNNVYFGAPTSNGNYNYYCQIYEEIQRVGGCITVPDSMLHNTQYLANMLNSGFAFLKEFNSKTNEWEDTSIATNTRLQEVQDESGLRKAEAKYEADMRRIDYKDRKYDYDLAALEAERNAIKNEMETLKTVAKDNVERTFKLFG